MKQMSQAAKDLYLFTLQTAIEKDIEGAKDLISFTGSYRKDKPEVEQMFYTLRNFCIDATDVMEKPIGNEGHTDAE